MDPRERERVRSEFFRLVLPKDLEETFIDFYRLFDFADETHRAFKDAPGVPHAVVDDFLTERGYGALLDALDALPSGSVWDAVHDAGTARLSAELYLPGPVRALFGELGTETFLAAMHSLTGVARLMPDPDRLEDGLVVIPPGSTWQRPVTPPRHPRLGLFRRVRLTLFACRTWKETWGGHLVLQSAVKPGWKETIPVRPNRCVVWNTPQHARVSHVAVGSSPDGTPLRCLTVSFYAAAPPAAQKQPQP